VLGVGGLAIVETASASGDSTTTSGESAALTEAQCEAEALQQPGALEGHYQLKNPGQLTLLIIGT
jgi:hypothetical protein